MAKILIITQRVPYPPNKGEKLRTYYQLQYLCNLGHSITVLSPIESKGELQHAAELADKLNIQVITKPLRYKWLRYLRALLSGQSLSEANFFSPELMTEFNTRAQTAAVVMCSASSLAQYVFRLSSDLKPLLLMDFMDVDSDKWLQYANNSSLPMCKIYRREHRLIKQLEQKIVGSFNYAFIIAKAEYDLFQSSVKECNNLKVLGNGIDQSEFKPKHRITAQTHFLFTGVMDYKPNVDAVLWFVDNCWDSIKAQVANARLTVAGMNPEQKIIALGKDKTIEITGFVNDIMPFFDRADVFVAPFQLARGVQNKVLQAMSCALPVVSTPLGAEGIICEHNKNMIVANSQLEFTNACISLAIDEQARKDIGHNAYLTIVDNYSWSSVLTPLQEAINQVRNLK